MRDTNLVNALREHAEWAQANEWETPITLSDDLAEAADLIEKLTARCARYAEEIAVAQERTWWIPVTGRLPEATDGDYVLACVTWKDTHIDYQNAVVMAFVSEDGLVDVEIDCVLDGVTHWMPLPEPPKEVE